MLRFSIVHQVEEGQTDGLRQSDGQTIAEDKYSKMLVGDGVDRGCGAQKKRSAMADLHVALRIRSYIPAQAVILIARAVVRFGGIHWVATDLRLVGLGERSSVHDL